MGNEDRNHAISRRDFLKGTATGAAGIAAASVLGSCAPKTTSNPEPQQTAASAEVAEEALLPEGARPIAPVTVPAKWDYEADVVVVGGGGSGLSSAISAAGKGAKVVVLEKNAFCGGDSSCAMIYGGSGSQFAEKLGIPTDTLANRVTHKLYIPNDTAGVNAEMVRKLVEMEGPTADWLESIGVVFEPGPINNIIPPGAALVPIDPENQAEGYYRWWPHNAKGITQALNQEALKQGTNILTETPAAALVTDGGKVVGVKATNRDGADVFVKGKVVILASGGYGANRDMMKAYVAPRRYETMKHWCLPSTTGDGIRMAQGVGASVNAMEEILTWDGPAVNSKEGMDLNYTTASQLTRQKSLSVNKLGKRFFNEATGAWSTETTGYDYQAAQKMAQQDATAFTLFDANCIKKEDIIAKFMPLMCEYPIPDWDKEFEEYLADGTILKADTIADLAAKMGVDAKTLQETIDRYNQMCEKGEDTDFFKDVYYLQPIQKAPFYAVESIGGACFQTYGGLIYDDQLRVLDEKWNPIPGLYVAGENGFCMNSLMRVLPSGRLAGENAAAEALA